jgi:signal transduction histidine kinase
VRSRLALRTRLTVWVAVLILFLVGAVLWVIQVREVDTIYEEQVNKGVLIARNVADANLRLLLFNDIEEIQSDLQSRINDQVLYAVIYDRFGTPLVYNSEIADRKEITTESRLKGEARPDSLYAQPRDVYFGRRLSRVLEIEIPIFAKGSQDKWGSVKIGLSLLETQKEIRKTRLVLILIGVAGFGLGLFGATVLSRRISRPIRGLAEGTVRISRGDFSHPIPIDSGDEFGDLARSFNDMTARLLDTRERMEETQRKLIQAEKLAQIGRLAATIAHEIRNPLTSVKLNIQKVVEDGRLPALELEHLAITQEGIVQIEKFIKELLNFTRASELHRARFPIAQIVDESLKVLAGCFQEKRVTVEKRIEDGLPEVWVDGDKMRQVFVNLVRNAWEAVGEAGRIKITAALTGAGAARSVRVRVSDNGCGIPEKDWENIFEPFFTTKSSGFGLGLANARKIVERHGGTIRVARKRAPGTAFEVLIPCEEDA